MSESAPAFKFGQGVRYTVALCAAPVLLMALSPWIAYAEPNDSETIWLVGVPLSILLLAGLAFLRVSFEFYDDRFLMYRRRKAIRGILCSRIKEVGVRKGGVWIRDGTENRRFHGISVMQNPFGEDYLQLSERLGVKVAKIPRS